MSDNRYDDYDDLPSVSIGDDDIGGRNYGRSRTVVKKSSPLLAFIVFLLVIAVGAMAGVGYFTIEKLRQENASLKKSQQKALTILSEVTGKVSATGVDLAKSASKRQAERTKMKQQLELAHSEIRKLWDVANKRNKSDIATNKLAADKNTQAIAKLTGSLNSKDAKVAQAIKLHKANQAKIAKLSSQLTQLKKTSNQLSQKLQSSPTDETALSVLEEQLNQLEQTVEVLSAQQSLSGKQDQAKQADLIKQVADHEDSLKAIDAFRRQVNSQLVQIKKKLK